MDLRKRFGTLVAAHRRNAELTQQELADRTEMSADMILRIETGGTGVRFATIEKLAAGLQVDPAAFFVIDPALGKAFRRPLLELAARLATLTDKDLEWVNDLLTSALKSRS